MDVLTCFLAVFLVTLISIYYFSKRHYDYWKKQKVPYEKPSFFFGNYGRYIKLQEHIGATTRRLCEKFPDSPYVGAFYGTEPTLIVQDPELLKLIMTKEFYYFSNREVSNYFHKELITQNLFFSSGDKWRVTRQNITPIFSSAKMKNMFHLIENCAHVFQGLLDIEYQKSDVLDIRDLMGRFTMDCIGSCVFGISTNAMNQETNNIFRRMGNLIFEVSNLRGLSLIGRQVYPSIFYGLGLKVFPNEINNFFFKLLTDVFASRNYHSSGRNDFVDLLLNLKKNDYITGDSMKNYKDRGAEKTKIKVDDEFFVIQCLTLFAAGFDTSASTLGFTLYELAKNKEAQQKAIEEVDEYLRKRNNELGYDCITQLPYLEACVDEALRLYPVLVVITREMADDYNLNGVELKKGIRIHIPVFHLQRRADLFPEPEKYLPERFLSENRHLIQPYTYLPFGEGPRACIGTRFAKMQILAGLVTILKKFTFELPKDMPTELSFEPTSIVTMAVGGIRVKAIPRPDAGNRIFSKHNQNEQDVY